MIQSEDLKKIAYNIKNIGELPKNHVEMFKDTLRNLRLSILEYEEEYTIYEFEEIEEQYSNIKDLALEALGLELEPLLY